MHFSEVHQAFPTRSSSFLQFSSKGRPADNEKILMGEVNSFCDSRELCWENEKEPNAEKPDRKYGGYS